MKKLLLLTFLFTSILCEAQQYLPVIEWQKTIGGNDGDELTSVIQTSNGFMLGGSSSSSNGFGSYRSESNRGGNDYWLIELNKTGNYYYSTGQFQKAIGGSFDDNLTSMQKTTDGGYILFGSSFSGISGEKSENGRGGNDFWIVKLNAIGNIEWQRTLGGSESDYSKSIQQTSDGGYILGGWTTSGTSGDKTDSSRGGFDCWIIKLNSTGIITWQKTIGGSQGESMSAINQTSDGGYILGGSSFSGISGEKTEVSRGSGDYWIVKLNASGVIQWQKTIGGSNYDGLTALQQTSEGGYILGGLSSSGISGEKTEASRGSGDYWIVKLNALGVIQWQKTIGGSNNDELTVLQQTSEGGYILGGYTSSGISGEKTEISRGSGDYWIVKLNALGVIQWQKTIGGSSIDILTTLQQTTEGGYILGGYSVSRISGEKSEACIGSDAGSYSNDYWVLKIKVIENPDSISGKVFHSKNSNCTQESNENGISNVILKTEPSLFFGVSDTAGKYTILVDTGIYKVKQITPVIYKPFLEGGLVCPVSGYHTVSFSQYGQDTTEINFANFEKQCAFLQVELTQDRMRRCFDNNATIKYCNIGNVDTNNVQVIVTLPEFVTFVSASNPNYTIVGKKITFNIGNLRANECGTINLVTKVDCVNGITGLTQCISAYILPRNKCVDQIQPDYALWDKSEVSVDGKCTGNTARFVIKNIGQNNMTDSSSYRIFKDAVQAVSRRFKLIAGDSLVINVTALGNTYRLEADQVPHFPSASTPSITIENCGTGVASRGFVNQQPQDMTAPNVEKICLPIRDSYDPNDKSVSPSGVGIGKLVKHKVPLDFLIRFQNTGTDTAYKVVIIDTLDQNLDLATLEFGASSHKYKIEFTGSGKPILKFTFDKINLVDSFTNEPKSHGFLSFKITPYDSIPNGTLVKNSADIYFDFNLPIKTNTTQVSIDDRLPTGATLNIVTSVKQQSTNFEAIYVYPNPFANYTNFEFVYNTKANQLIVYDIKGQLVAKEIVSNKTNYQFQRNNLPNGMYFYNIENNEGEIIGRGKLVLQ